MSKPTQSSRMIAEFIPLLLFFVTYHNYGMMHATAVLVVTSIISVSYIYIKERTIPHMLLFSAIILTIFGGLTIAFDDALYIKLKPTIINSLFFVVLVGGAIKGKGLLKYLLTHAFEMDDKAWIKFSYRWGFFFLFLAVVNEVVWRNFSEEFWVSFKVFGMLPLSIGFMLTQIPFIYKHAKFDDKDAAKLNSKNDSDS